MDELVIRGGLLADPERGTVRPGDLAVRDGRIARSGPPGSLRGVEVLDAAGLLVSPGLIDVHAHVYPDRTGLGVPPDEAGIRQGVTTVADAGSCGSDDMAHFEEQVRRPARTRVLSWINVSRHGLVHGHSELAGGEGDIDAGATAEALRSAGVRGVKVRMSKSVLGESGLAPLRAAKRLGAPVMVHVGNEPPALGEVLDLLGAGDVVTHAFHGKCGGLFPCSASQEPIPAARAAVERGVRFDVGHGSASFAFGTAERALAAGIRPYTISTDLHRRNIEGPVHSLTTTLSKLLALGMPLTEVLACVTVRAAEVLGLAGELGTLRAGAVADLSLLKLRQGPVVLTDAMGREREAAQLLVPHFAVRAGRVHAVAVPEAAA